MDGQWASVAPAVEAKIAKAVEGKAPGASAEAVRAATLDSLRAIMMIRAYRMRGHLAANLDPLGLDPPKDASELDPATYGFAEADYDRPIFLDYVMGMETSTIREMLEILRRTYCGNVGVQYMHISDPTEKAWLQERIEGRDKEIVFSKEGKVAILKKLIETEGFEKFLHKRFPGTKRFGLDGGESMVPAMEQIIKRGGALGVKDIVLGMPHRGRLNVLAAVMGKPYHVIFHEFQGGSSVPSDIEGSGDVKYHMGASSDREFDDNKVHLSLTANPSHLEIVNPVVIGKARAKQAFTLREQPDAGRGHVLPLLLHGDAAFAGQGVVAECFTLSGLKGYRTGGTIHFIVNNQIGFTTSPRYSRSSPYPSDMALMVEAPIFHVNGDDPEAVVHIARIDGQFVVHDAAVDMFHQVGSLWGALRQVLSSNVEGQSGVVVAFNPASREAQSFLSLVIAVGLYLELRGVEMGEAGRLNFENLPRIDDPAIEGVASKLIAALNLEADRAQGHIAPQAAASGQAAGAAPVKPAAAQVIAIETAAQGHDGLPQVDASHLSHAASSSASASPAPLPQPADGEREGQYELSLNNADVRELAFAGAKAAVVGTNGDDYLHGTAEGEVIAAGAGNDYIDGGGAGKGQVDRIDGGAGDDRIVMNARVVASGSAGADAFLVSAEPPKDKAETLLGVVLDYHASKGDHLVVMGKGEMTVVTTAAVNAIFRRAGHKGL